MNIISQCRGMFFSDIPFVNRIDAKTRIEEVKCFARIPSSEDVCIPSNSVSFIKVVRPHRTPGSQTAVCIEPIVNNIGL